MAIFKVNSNNTIQNKIEQLNNMVMELEGLISQAKFNKNEIDNLYTQLAVSGFGLDRQYIRNVSLGNTVSTYTNWSHISTQTGYSIWKITPATYVYNANNQVYLDDRMINLRGQASSETQTAFDYVYNFDGESGGGYTDDTTEAGTTGGTEFNLMDSTTDYLYVGLSATFAGIDFKFESPGSGNTLVIEYYDDSSGVNDFVPLTANDDNLVDNTNNFVSDGAIFFDNPTDWGTTAINGQTKYWIRISSSATPVTVADVYQITPANNVISMLSLSSTEIQDEEWTWCEYSGAVYVTIRNAGNTSYEGNYYITSASSATNLENFFVHNHIFASDYQDSTY